MVPDSKENIIVPGCEEIIHPRIMYENGIPCVRYCKKDLITIQDFLTILASNKNDLIPNSFIKKRVIRYF